VPEPPLTQAASCSILSDDGQFGVNLDLVLADRAFLDQELEIFLVAEVDFGAVGKI
jgi:hypothetical protein